MKLTSLSAIVLAAVTAVASAQPAPCPEERQRAATVRDRIERDWPLRRFDTVTAYIDRFGYQLAARSGIATVSNWRFRVIQDTSINAYSIGDGLIYITEGAIVTAADDSELAAILAHEMGHDIAGHLCPRANEVDDSPSWNIFAPSTDKPSALTTESHYGRLRQVIDPVKEREAERNAAVILRKAGYDTGAIQRVERRISRQTNTSSWSQQRSHLSYYPDHGHPQTPAAGQGVPSHTGTAVSADLQAIQQTLRNDHR